jgi:hypothetical protein
MFRLTSVLAVWAWLAFATTAFAEEKDAAFEGEAPRPSGLELSAGPRVVHRDLSYSDEVAALFPSQKYPKLAPYRLGLGPAAFAAVELFPGAFGGRGLVSQLGVVASYERAFATSVLFAEGTSYERKLDTRSQGFFLGGKARLPLGEHELSLVAGYGGSSYELLGDEASPVVPDIAYRYLRVDAGARFGFGAPFVRLHLGTRFVTSSGAIADAWFPGATVRAFEGGVGAGYVLSRALELELGLDYLRYGFDFNPIPASADPWTRPIAGGAIDQYLNVSLALRYRFGGEAT